MDPKSNLVKKPEDYYNTELSKYLTKISSSEGFPTYNENYVMLEKHIRTKLTDFNNQLRKQFNFEEIKSSPLLLDSNPNVKYYRQKFPEKLYHVCKPSQKPKAYLKPACCSKALEIVSKKKYLKDNHLVHQYSDCFRLEKEGEIRAMKRSCYFTMPDYHLVIKKEKMISAYNYVQSALDLFYKNLLNFEKKDFKKKYVVYDESFLELAHQNLEDLTKEKEKPYFGLKLQYDYEDSQIGTVQIDTTLPSYFGLKDDYVCIHFSTGSILRLMPLIFKNKRPVFALKVVLKKTSLQDLNFLKPYNLILQNKTENLSESICATDLEKFFYPLVLIYGEEQKTKNHYTLLNRFSKEEFKFKKENFLQYLNNNEVLKQGEIFYTKSSSLKQL